MKNEGRFADVTNLNIDDPNVAEMLQHDEQLSDSTTTVPAFLLSPMTQLIWLNLCATFRKHLDFNFQRHDDWNDNCTVNRFNNCLYVQRHS